MLTLQVPSPKVLRPWVWPGSSGRGNRYFPAPVAPAGGAELELWAGKTEAAEVETAPTWVQLLSPHASSPGGHPSPKVLPLALGGNQSCLQEGRK